MPSDRTGDSWKVKMQRLLAVWRKEFLENSGQVYPTDFTELEILIRQAATAANVRDLSWHKWWDKLERIASRNKELEISPTFDALVAKLEKTPPEPALGITNAARKRSDAAGEMLKVSAEALMNRIEAIVEISSPDWRSWFDVLVPFTSKQFRSVAPWAVQNPNSSIAVEPSLYPLLVYASHLDIQRQVDTWWTRYSSAQRFARWLCSVNHPATDRLLQIFPYVDACEVYIRPEHMKRADRRRRTKIKKRRKLSQQSGQ